MTTGSNNPPVHRDVGSESVGSLLSNVTSDLSTLMRQELELAKTELKQEAKDAGKAGAMFGGAGVAGWMVLLFGSAALMWGLGNVMDMGWAALIVTGIWLVIAVVLFVAGRSRARQVNPVPEQTVQSLKEDKEWIAGRKS